MADNYLESKFEEMRNPRKGKTIIRQVGQGLDSLLLKNRSVRGYDHQQIVSREMLERIVSVNVKIPSARNQQVLRFKLVTCENGANKVLNNIKLGGALPELHLPFPETEPQAFILVCSTIAESKMVDIDLGISAQSMLLKAVELGLNGVIIGAYNKAKLMEEFALPYELLLILAIGKSAETIQLKEISADENHSYYRKDGVHIVPKIRLSELLLP